MDKITIFEVAIVLLTFWKAWWVGILVFVYILFRRYERKNSKVDSKEALEDLESKWQEKYEIVKNQLDAVIDERKEKKQTRKWLKETPRWKVFGFASKEEYQAEKEKRLRKQEQDYFLSKAYKHRQSKSTLKKNLAVIDDLLRLTPVEFEKWVKQNVFEKSGWNVEETKVTGDGGIDLVLNKDGEHSIAQCKRFKNTVGEPVLRDFYGTMMSEGVSKGYFVTTGLFSLSAQKFAEEKPIILIDRGILANMLSG